MSKRFSFDLKKKKIVLTFNSKAFVSISVLVYLARKSRGSSRDSITLNHWRKHLSSWSISEKKLKDNKRSDFDD